MPHRLSRSDPRQPRSHDDLHKISGSRTERPCSPQNRTAPPLCRHCTTGNRCAVTWNERITDLLLNSNVNQILKYKLPTGGGRLVMCLDPWIFRFTAIATVQAQKVFPARQFCASLLSLGWRVHGSKWQRKKNNLKFMLDNHFFSNCWNVSYIAFICTNIISSHSKLILQF